jgi:hypothetical protein
MAHRRSGTGPRLAGGCRADNWKDLPVCGIPMRRYWPMTCPGDPNVEGGTTIVPAGPNNHRQGAMSLPGWPTGEISCPFAGNAHETSEENA